MTIVSLIELAASIFTAISMIPQLIKVLKEKKAENESLAMLAVLLGGLGFWVYYGLLKNDQFIFLQIPSLFY